MRTLTAILASTFALFALPFAGCSGNDANTTASSAGFTGGLGGGSQSSGCNNGQPDGFCNFFGQNPETCACPDCSEQAACTMKCTDDMACQLGDGLPEDCTCNDCYFKVADCPPANVGCGGGESQNDGVCDLDEDCTCGDCTNSPRCTMNCFDNGSCVPYLEGCSCNDCKVLEECGGSGTTSSSSTAAASTSAASSTAAATTGAGGAGGAGGMGGAGGAGGVGGN